MKRGFLQSTDIFIPECGIFIAPRFKKHCPIPVIKIDYFDSVFFHEYTGARKIPGFSNNNFFYSKLDCRACAKKTRH